MKVTKVKCLTFMTLVVVLSATAEIRVWDSSNAKATPGVWRDYLERMPSVELVSFDGFSRPDGTVSLHFGSWQNNGYFLRHITNANQVNQPIADRFVTSGNGRLNDNLWRLSATQIYQATEKPLLPHELGPIMKHNKPLPSNAQLTAFSAERKLVQTLQFGLRGLDPSSIQWSNDHFRATMDGADTISRWILDDRSRISELIIDWDDQKELLRMKYLYDESNTNLPAFYPTEMQKFGRKGGKEVLLNRIQVFTLKFAEQVLPDERFLPEFQLPNRSITNVLILTKNNEDYHADIVFERQRGAQGITTSSEENRSILVGVLLTVSALSFALIASKVIRSFPQSQS